MSCLVRTNSPSADALASLQSLGAGFEPESVWTQVSLIEPSAIPEPARQLLVHDRHMTAMLNQHHGQQVSLRVLDICKDDGAYRRKILLTIRGGAQVVEYGLVRLNLAELPDAAQREVMAEELPLGEVFARFEVLTRVDVRWYLRFPVGSPIVDYLGQKMRGEAFARLGWIHCNGRPAVELLEVVPG